MQLAVLKIKIFPNCSGAQHMTNSSFEKFANFVENFPNFVKLCVLSCLQWNPYKVDGGVAKLFLQSGGGVTKLFFQSGQQGGQIIFEKWAAWWPKYFTK